MSGVVLRGPAAGARELVALFGLALAARLAVLCAAAWATGWAPLDLAMLADGHSDMVLSKSFPELYVGTQRLVPFVTIWRDDPYAFFTRFPLYPTTIWLASTALGDLRLSALVVSQLAGALAVVRFRTLAGVYTPRATLAAALFAVFPATWLETTSLAYTEGLLVLCAVSAFAAFAGGRLWVAVAWAGAATLVQKHGVLLVPALAASQWVAGRRRPADLAPLALALVPFAALQLYWWVLSGSPLTAFERTSAVFAGPTLTWPLTAFVESLVAPGQVFTEHFWLRKVALVGSLGFYAWMLRLGIRRRDPHEAPLWIWLGTVLALCISMGGVWAYYNFPRFMLLAAPAAVVLAADRFPWPRRRALQGLLLAGIALGAATAAVLGTEAMWDLCMRAWSPRYYEQLRPLLRG